MDNRSVEDVAKGLSEAQRELVIATPADVFDDAGMIAWRAKLPGYSHRFAPFAARNPALIERHRNYAGTKYLYSLTPLGLAVRAHLKDQSHDQ